ncbi:hypothetical protein T02_4060 [Trichinella nativa]|uniref:Uncharacterized protein n=1 Tax=Trichinella nativa TaxID=6335 RepID=A0A0V1L4Q6_9BILA|nr:hypothetical protein T02_4060 [Trichinella nativa]
MTRRTISNWVPTCRVMRVCRQKPSAVLADGVFEMGGMGGIRIRLECASHVDFSYSTYMWTVSSGILSIRLVNGGTTFSRYDDLLEDQHEHIDKLKKWRYLPFITAIPGNSCMNSRHQSEQSSAIVANNCISGGKVHERKSAMKHYQPG